MIEGARRAVAARLAERCGIGVDEARSMVDDVVEREVDSPHHVLVLAVIAEIVRPVINEIKHVMTLPDPYSPDATVTVMAALAASLSEVDEP